MGNLSFIKRDWRNLALKLEPLDGFLPVSFRCLLFHYAGTQSVRNVILARRYDVSFCTPGLYSIFRHIFVEADQESSGGFSCILGSSRVFHDSPRDWWSFRTTDCVNDYDIGSGNCGNRVFESSTLSTIRFDTSSMVTAGCIDRFDCYGPGSCQFTPNTDG